MSAKHEMLVENDLFYIFVDLARSEFYVVPSAEVAAYLRAEHADWLGAKPGRVTNAERIWRADEEWLNRWCVLSQPAGSISEFA